MGFQTLESSLVLTSLPKAWTATLKLLTLMSALLLALVSDGMLPVARLEAEEVDVELAEVECEAPTEPSPGEGGDGDGDAESAETLAAVAPRAAHTAYGPLRPLARGTQAPPPARRPPATVDVHIRAPRGPPVG